MKILHEEIVDGEKIYGTTEFTACRISKHETNGGYCVRLYTESPSRFYKIIRSERNERGVYRWLLLEEANNIVQKLYKNDCLNLTETGNYHIFEENFIQTVYIHNDINEFTDEYIPIKVTFAEE